MRKPRKYPARPVLNSGICFDEDDDAGLLYHALPASLVPTVLHIGLKPSAQPASFRKLQDWSEGKVFLSAGYSNAQRWQSFIAEETGLDTAILEVNLPPSWLEFLYVDEISAMEGDPCAFYITKPIAPQFLKLVDSGWGTALK